jgi:glycerol-3-phosphate dehydrogenase
MPFTTASRPASSGRGDTDVFDLLVVGGGIVGAGIARDAALRGLGVLLIEQADFAQGTSGRSSRLLHGGLRYLAQGRLGLVREASREKLVLQRIAPHLVHPLGFVFPTRRGSYWSKWKLRIGVRIYDRLSGRGNFSPSQVFDAAQTSALLPLLKRENLTGAVRYFDALTSDTRLVLDTLRSAAAAGAICLNHRRLAEARRENSVWVAALHNRRNGTTTTVRARAVINATGPWSDTLPQSGTRLRLTKGVHLVIRHDRLPIGDAVVMTEGRRILFAIPWGERVVLGTTDTDYDGPLDEPLCERTDAEYVLRVVDQAFPGAKIGLQDVTGTWAGLRPLVADRHGRPSDISRRHEIRMAQPGWWDVTGGKLTTYRLIGQQAVEAVAGGLERPVKACQTATQPLLAEQPEIQGISGVLAPPVNQSAVEHYVRHEWALDLEDVMVRRTAWHYQTDDPDEVARRVASWMSGPLGWDDAACRRQVERYATWRRTTLMTA